MEIIRTVFCSHKFVKIRLFVLVGLMGLNLSGCTAIAVTGALSTATKAVVSVVTLPVKAVTSIAGGDDEEAMRRNKLCRICVGRRV